MFKIKNFSVVLLGVLLNLILFSKGYSQGCTTTPTTVGQLTTNETWCNTVTLTGDVIVPSGVTLTISAGTIVKATTPGDAYNGGTDTSRIELLIKGILTAEGTAASRITFTSTSATPAKNDWTGIIFDASSGSSVKYCKIEYASTGIKLKNTSLTIDSSIIENMQSDGIYIVSDGSKNDTITITNNTLSNITNSGIYGFSYNVTITITNNTLSNISYGIYCRFGKKVAISGNTVYNFSSAGIFSDSNTEYTIDNNTVRDASNTGTWITGISVSGGTSGTISKNTVYKSGIGIYNSSNTVNITKNSVYNNTGDGIQSNGGANIYINHNNFCVGGVCNTGYDLKVTNNQQLDAKYNWWGATTTNEMNTEGYPSPCPTGIDKIWDICEASSSLGVANYSGWLSAEVENINPITSNVIATPSPVKPGDALTLTATVSDTTTGGSNIITAEYFINTTGDYGTGTPMLASDGSFNSTQEGVTASVTTLAWTHGQSYTLYVRGKDASGNWGDFSSVAVSVDNTPPSDITNIYDGTGGVDIQYTTSTTQLSANWTASTDAESGTAIKYLYAIGTTQGGTDLVGWTDNGVELSTTRTGLTLTNGQIYHFTVKAENGVGLQSATTSSNGQKVDNTPPSDLTTVNDGTGADIGWTNSTTQLSANWTASTDAESNIARYWYAIGTTQGGRDLVGWTDNGVQLSTTGLTTLAEGQIYYFTVKAENGAGLQSATTSSDGQIVDSTAPTTSTITLPAANAMLNGTITITSNAVDNAGGSGIEKVEFYEGTTKLGDDTTSPYSYDWITTSPNDSVKSLTAKAIDKAGNSTTSGAVNITVDNTPPTVQAGADGVTNTQITQNATASDTTSGIATYLWTKQQGQGTITFGAPSAKDTTISANQDGTYTIRLTVTDNAGNSAYDEMILVWDTTAPSAIAPLSATPPTTNSVTLTWTAVGDDGNIIGIATTYDIRYSTSTIDDTNWSLATQSAGEPAPNSAGTTNETFTVIGLNFDTTYYFAIKVSDEVPNTSGLSNVVSATTPKLPSAPAGLTATAGDTQISLSWTASTAGTYTIAGYNVYRSTTQGSGHAKVNTTAITTTSYSDTGLTNCTTYYYVVKSVDTQGNESSNSSETSAAPQDTTAPSAITTLSAGSATTNSIPLIWTAVGDDGNIETATSYDIRYSTSTIDDANWALATQSAGEPAPKAAGTTSETFTVTGLSSDTIYYFAIKVSDEACPSPNTSGLSNVVSGKTQLEPPSVPTNLTTTAGDTQISLSWTASTAGTYTIAGYNVYRSTTSGSNYAKVNTPVITTISYTDTGLPAGASYYYVVRAVDTQNNESGNSNEAGATTTEQVEKTMTDSPSANTFGMKSIISIPANNSTDAVFGSAYVRRWDPTIPDAQDDPTFKKYKRPEKINPWEGYWIYSTTGGDIKITGSMVDQTKDGKIRLHPGWNQISSAFEFDVLWSDCKTKSLDETKIENIDASNTMIKTTLYWRDNNSDIYSSADPANAKFKAWGGYWVKAETDCYLIIPAKPAPVAKLKETVSFPEDALLKISAKAGEYQDLYNFIGISSKAENGYDIFDVEKPPGISPFVSVYFPHYEWGKDKGIYASDIRRKRDDVTWNMTVETDITNTSVLLSWEKIKGGDDAQKIALLDISTNTFIDITQNSSYTYFSGNGGKREFKILYGKEIIEKEEEKRKGPANLLSVYTYPNPYRGGSAQSVSGDGTKGKGFSSPSGITFRYKLSGQVIRVEIEVYTITGKRVDTFEGELDGETVWSFGEKLSNGVYIYRITAFDASGNTVNKINKLVVIK